MSALQPGDVVDVEIRGARVVEAAGDYLSFDYGDGGEHFRTGVRVDAESVEVSHVASAQWPPMPGEVWRVDADAYTRDYFVRSHNCTHDEGTCFAAVELIDPDGGERPYPLETTVPAGMRPLVRVYPAPAGGAR